MPRRDHGRRIVFDASPETVHASFFAQGTPKEYDETLCEVRVPAGRWDPAPEGAEVNCVLCLAYTPDEVPYSMVRPAGAPIKAREQRTARVPARKLGEKT